MRKYCEAILRVIELFCEGVYIKYMTEQKSDNSLKSVRNIYLQKGFFATLKMTSKAEKTIQHHTP